MGRFKGTRKQKSHVLEPQKTQKCKLVRRRNFDQQEFVEGTSSLSPSLTTSENHSIVPYEEPLLSCRRISPWERKRQLFSSRNHRRRKELETLSDFFNPIPFICERPQNVEFYKSLLTRLGLWDFLHLDFDRNIRSDLIQQLVIYYDPKKPWNCRSNVNGYKIRLNRPLVAHALTLPSRRYNDCRNDSPKTGSFLMVSEKELLFLEEMVFSWMVLQDDDCELPDEVKKAGSLIRERRLGEVDWGGLMWFMMERELLKGDKLVNCYYASHMQLLLKYQKPRLFKDNVELPAALETGAVVSDDVVNRGTGLFSEDFEKERFLDVETCGMGGEESEREEKKENIVEMCYKRKNSYFKKIKERKTLSGKINSIGDEVDDGKVDGVAPSRGNLDMNEVQDHTVVELCCEEGEDVTLNDLDCKEIDNRQGESSYMEGENGSRAFSFDNGLLTNENIDEEGKNISNKQEIAVQPMDLVVSSRDEDKKVLGETFLLEKQQNSKQEKDGNIKFKLLHCEGSSVAPSCVLSNSLEDKVSNDSECQQMYCEPPELNYLLDTCVEVIESDSANNALIDEDSNEEGLKTKCSTDLKMDEKHTQETDCLQMDSVLSQDKGERENGLNVLVEDHFVTEQNVCTSDEQRATQKEDENGKLRLRNKLSEGLVEDEVLVGKHSESLDSQEKMVSNEMDCQQARLTDTNLLYGSSSDALMNEECNDEGLEMEYPRDSTKNYLDLVLSQDQGAKESSSDALKEDCNVAGEEFCLWDEQHAVKMEDKNMQLRLLISEDQKLVKEGQHDAKVGELLDNQELEVGLSVEKSSVDSENENTEMAMEEENPELLAVHGYLLEGKDIAEPEAMGLNELLGSDMDLQNKNAVKTEPFVEPFVSEHGKYMNSSGTSFDNSLKREIDHLNDTQSERLSDGEHLRGVNSAAEESLNLDWCTKQAQLSVMRLHKAAHIRAHRDNEVNEILLKELEEKNRVIEQYRKTIIQEQQKHEKDMGRCQRELYLTKLVMEEYRTALEEVHKSFSQYRARAQLPEEPIYVDHPDGSGKVVLATELGNSGLKQEHQNL